MAVKLSFIRIVTGSFVLAILILAIIGVITYRSTVGLMQTAGMVAHTHEVLERLESLQTGLSDAETGERGYIITGDEKFLDSYYPALELVRTQLDQIRELTIDNPRQQERLAKLKPLVEEKLAIVKRVIALSKDGTFENGGKAEIARGKAVMTEVRELVAVMKDEERRLLKARDETARGTAQKVITIFWSGEAVGLALLTAVFYQLTREMKERKRGEEKIVALNEHLSAHTTSLEAANKELEAFSYSVSHDLRAPLRHISGFVDLLSKHGSAGDDPKAARYLKFISGSAQQMGKLVDDLLSFSRMGRAEMRFTDISLQRLAGEIKDELAASYRGRSIDWDINSLPEVQADPAMMRQVVLNLFSNAVKYTGTRAAAKIEVGHLPSEAEHIVFVRDNGVGFDMKYSDKLFGVFQRLHHADEFEGTGIGLANVRRVIHRHGGRTWAEAVPDRGATFYFAIPKKPKPPAPKTTS